MKKTLLVLAVLGLSTSLFAQQRVIVPMWDESGKQWYGAFPQSEIPAVPNSLVFVHDTVTEMSGHYGPHGKGAQTEGNTTISGSLTVTGTCFFGTSSNPVNAYGGVIASGAIVNAYDAPAANTMFTITKDVTDIQDAGGTVTITLPTATNGRTLFIYNESATYNVTDGSTVTIAPNTGTTLHAVGGSWK